MDNPFLKMPKKNRQGSSPLENPGRGARLPARERQKDPLQLLREQIRQIRMLEERFLALMANHGVAPERIGQFFQDLLRDDSLPPEVRKAFERGYEQGRREMGSSLRSLGNLLAQAGTS